MIKLQCGDCLQLMRDIPAGAIDLIICDLPYGVTKNRWDNTLPFDRLWGQYLRVIKPDGAICLFADGLFMANLMLSQPKLWRYNLVWDKVLTSGFLNANRMPLRQHEEICVFYKKAPEYHPQKIKGAPNHSKGDITKTTTNNNYGNFVPIESNYDGMKHPTSILRFQKPHPSITEHPTQKPVELCEWLIHSYSSPGDTVLDNCMGVGTTGIAAKNLGRNFIGIEIEECYFNIAKAKLGE